MIKANKRYTIKFSKAGIDQYAHFSEKDGKIIHQDFYPTHVKAKDVPSLEGVDNIEEILKIIKEFSYANIAEIEKINGCPVNYYNNTKAKKYIKGYKDRFDIFIEKEAVEFFEKHLYPIMEKNQWFISTSHIGIPVLASYNDDGVLENISPNNKDEEDFEYLCSRFTSEFKKSDNMKFSKFFSCISTSYFVDKKLYIEN